MINHFSALVKIVWIINVNQEKGKILNGVTLILNVKVNCVIKIFAKKDETIFLLIFEILLLCNWKYLCDIYLKSLIVICYMI